MRKETAGFAPIDPADADIIAIRSLMAETPQDAVPDRQLTPSQARFAAKETPQTPAKKKRAYWMLWRHPDQMKPLEGPDAEPTTSTADGRWFAVACARLGSYRPDRGNILWTSLVLILLLKPLFVLGWSLALVSALAACYLYSGADLFWRNTILLHQTLRSHWPGLARQITLRAYILGKKWDAGVARLPECVAHAVRKPDLRAMLAADLRHDAVLSDRLNRMRQDRFTP